MLCPRCGQPTHVLDTRVRGSLSKRVRMCGKVKGGRMITPTCGLRFATIEVPLGWERKVSIQMTDDGLLADVVKKEPNR